MNATQYIKENWKNTVHQPEDPRHGAIYIPYPYTVPCAGSGFTDFYYWDTYFTNLGLMLSGMDEQAENNLNVMRYFIEHLGYVPNANCLTDRSQPPLFTRGVYDLYRFRGDENIIRNYIDFVLKELSFWEYDRMTPVGLNAYSCHATRIGLKNQSGLAGRVGEVRESEEEYLHLTKQLLGIAESGWDFTPRFRTATQKFASDEYAHLDLNSILYDAEIKAAEMLSVIGRDGEAATLRDKANARLEKMKTMMAEDGVYYDYCYTEKHTSPVLSCASFYVYAMGISDDAEAAGKVLAGLEQPFGVSACEKRGENEAYLQWDYPAMWPSNVYFAYTGLMNVGRVEDARRVAQKYIDTVDRCFAESGALWEKYDASTGGVSVTSEYVTPTMMGWTAGVYLYLMNALNQ